MLKTSLHESATVVVLEPSAKVSKANITKSHKAIQPWLADGADTLLIISNVYDDWDTLAALFEPLMDEESRDKIQSIAVVTDKPTGVLSATLKGLYSNAKLFIYCYAELDAAMQWLIPVQEDSAA
ncbi:MAG: STAS/SEC14 domain-containing protein [Pseudomonadales bacterium]|nr:STAS/SEC14 domain-containing protein [Pseudomonadales bacterium]